MEVKIIHSAVRLSTLHDMIGRIFSETDGLRFTNVRLIIVYVLRAKDADIDQRRFRLQRLVSDKYNQPIDIRVFSAAELERRFTNLVSDISRN